MSRYDDEILKSIEDSFKDISTISAETNITPERVAVRLAYMRKTKQVIWIKEIRGSERGPRAKKYRKSPALS